MSAITLAKPSIASIEPSPASRALGALRSQAAFLRSLLDELERVAPASRAAESLGDQVVEELSRLGCRSLEAASELSRVVGARRCADVTQALPPLRSACA